MGMFCSIWGCSEEPKDFWGENAEYVLFKCKRCKKETIFCSKEGKLLNNDEEGRKLRDLMMTDADFSRQCTIHSEFIKAETDNPFSYTKQESDLDRVREKYGLKPGFRQPDPVILWRKGLWKPNPSNSDGESKAKPKKKTSKKKGGEKPIQLEGGENLHESDNVVKVEIRITKGGENDRDQWVDLTPEKEEKEPELSVEAQISRLERRMSKHVAREEYEKAAKLRDQISKLKGEN